MTSRDESKTRLRRRTVLAAAIAVMGLAGAVSVRADPDPVGLKVVDRETGQELQTWRHHGRLFVAGEPGARYGLRLANHTDGRVLLVLSVDGVNVVTGETAAYSQRGYVLDPHEAYDVNGWRKSNTEIAAFAFAPLPQSYAARTGRPADVGVIGMAVFKERPPVAPVRRLDSGGHGLSDIVPHAARAPRAVAGYSSFSAPNAPSSPTTPPPPPPPPPPPVQPRAPAVVAPNIPAPPPMFIKPVEAPRPPSPASSQSTTAAIIARQAAEKLGTAHGAREWSVAIMTTFERAAPHPQWIEQVEYDTYDNLVAGGVIRPSPDAEHRPQPFPRNPGGAGFVPDPPIDP